MIQDSKILKESQFSFQKFCTQKCLRVINNSLQFTISSFCFHFFTKLFRNFSRHLNVCVGASFASYIAL